MAVSLSESRALKVLSVTGDRFSLDDGVLGGELRRTEVIRDVGEVRAVALSPSGSVALIACADGTLWGLDVRSWEPVWRLRTEVDLAPAVALASDAGPIVAGLADGTVRHYAVGGGMSDVAGPGPPVRALAVTPDGAAIVAGRADGTLLRWNSRDGGPPRIWRIAPAITAVAVGAGGDCVLAAADDSKVRVYDFAAGQSVGFAVGEERAVASAQQYSRPAFSPAEGKAGAASAVDDDVRFTVYRPQALPPETWATLLVFAHKTGLIREPGRPPFDPNTQVEARARAHFGDAAAPPARSDARYEVTRGTQLRIVPELPGILCNPREAVIDWWEPVHQVEFRVLAAPALAGSVVRGPVRIWCGPLILGEVFLAIPVAMGADAALDSSVADSAPRYRKIFPSYSRQDSPLLASFTEAARAIGDTYLQDVLTLRSGERWEPRLLQLIEEADIFQLFWSSNSMRSPHCRNEWEHAVSLQRTSFIRPLYWERPLPQDPILGLPPASLRTLHFVHVQMHTAAPSAPQYRGTAGLLAPPPQSPSARQPDAAPSAPVRAPDESYDGFSSGVADMDVRLRRARPSDDRAATEARSLGPAHGVDEGGYSRPPDGDAYEDFWGDESDDDSPFASGATVKPAPAPAARFPDTRRPGSARRQGRRRRVRRRVRPSTALVLALAVIAILIAIYLAF